MSSELGSASYELDANLEPLRRGFKEGKADVKDFERVLDHLTVAADITAKQLGHVKMSAGQGAESRASAESILQGVRGISDEARVAARELDHVKLTEAQATESEVAGERIKRNVNDIGDEADRTKRKLEEVRLAGGRNGTGVGPFGSGFGRIGVLGAAVGTAALTTPAAGPAALGLLAATPVLAGAAAGSLGVLALAFDGVGKAISGDKKAFDGLGPSAQAFVQTVRSLDGWFEKMKETAAGSLFPGLTAGLKAALSPGTVGAITTAVTDLGHALGAAGAAWGRYFGSSEFQSIFGPLMQSAARTIGNLSAAALQLFDALGVVARAAIPLTDWMTRGIANASAMAAAWLHAKDATGELGGAMNEAKTSLQLVGALLGSLLRAVGALGQALYPVSKVAVKDLTDGLNALANLIGRNQTVIREIISTALTGLVTVVKIVVDGVRLLNDALTRVISNKAGVVTAIVAIGIALSLTLGPESVVIGGVLLAIGYIKDHWDKISEYIKIAADKLTLAILEPFSHLPGKLGEWARTAKDQVEQELASARDDLAAIGTRNGDAYGKAFADAVAANPAAAPPGYKTGSYGSQPSTPANPGGYTTVPDKIPNASFTQSQVYKLLLANGIPKDVATNLSIISARGEDPSGSPYALNDNASTGDYSVGLFQENFLGQMGVDRVRKYAPKFGQSPTTSVKAFVSWLGKHPSAQAQIAYDIFQSQGYGAWTTAAGLGITGGGATAAADPWGGSTPAWSKNTGPKPPKPPTIPNMITDLLNKASANASKSKQLGNLGGTAKRYLENELGDLNAADTALHKLVPKTARDRQQVKAKETEVENKIRDVHTLIKNSAFATGDELLSDALKSKLTGLKAKFKADSTFAQVLTGKAAEAYAATLQGDITGEAAVLADEVASLKSKLAGATGRQKKAIQAELTKVTGQLATVQEQVVQTLQGAVQTMQQHVATQFGRVQTQLLTQLGAKFFQNGLLTPLEKQLADMQAQDTADSLKDALKSAQDQLATDLAASADAATIAADNKAIAQAQRAITENDLSIRASAERRQADADYAVAQQQLSDKLADLADAFQNGTATMDDLTSLAAGFGLTIDQVNTPSFSDLATATSNLQTAFGALKDYIYKLTGTRPTDGGDSTPPAAGTNQFGTMDPGIAAVLGMATDTAVPDALARYLIGHALPMADGGIGRAIGPTLFYSGGHEDFAFSGEGGSFGSRGGDEHYATVGSVGNEVALGIYIGKLMQQANKSGIRFQLV